VYWDFFFYPRALSTMEPEMNLNPHAHHRHSLRLIGYDYSQAGAYFVTICTQGKKCLFGEIIDGEMRLSESGQGARLEWLKTAVLRPDTALDEFSIMPNHIHGIIILRGMGIEGPVCRGTARCAQEPMINNFGQLLNNSIPAIVRAYKSAVTKLVNELRGTSGVPVWQRNYYEHIIRNEEDLNNVRQYIEYNPAKWAEDVENPVWGGSIP
jgi:putative transposase